MIAAIQQQVSPIERTPLDLGVISGCGFSARLAGEILSAPPVPAHLKKNAIARHHVRWGLRMNLMPRMLIEQLALWRLWTGCLRDLSARVASILPDYRLMLIVLDDSAECYFSPQGGDPNALHRAFRIFDGVFSQPARHWKGERVTAFPNFDAIKASLIDLRGRIVHHANGRMLPLLFQGFRDYLRGVRQQMFLSREQIITSPATQLYNRTVNAAIDPSITLVCALAGVDYRDERAGHPMFERVHQAACRASGLLNDILSFPRELATGDASCACQNHLGAQFYALYKEESRTNPLNEAVRRGFAAHNAEMMDLITLGERLRAESTALDRYITLNVEMHRSWFQWMRSVPRYAPGSPSAS